MSQFYVNSGGSPPSSNGILTLSSDGGIAHSPDIDGNFDFSSSNRTVEFIASDGSMDAIAVFPKWQLISSDQSAEKSQGYLILNPLAVTTIALPNDMTVQVGDSFQVCDVGGGTFVISQIAGQSISYGDLLTTTGVGGSLSSEKAGDGVTLVCWAVGPGSSWIVVNSTGNILVT